MNTPTAFAMSPGPWNRKPSDWDRIKEAIRRDWEQTKHDLHVGGHEMNQTVDDTLAQAIGEERIPPFDGANPPKVLATWDQVEVPIGFGYAARTYYGARFPKWNGELDLLLADEWKKVESTPWSTVKIYVQHGYDLRH